MKNSIKILAALMLSLPLVMTGCTCSQQESADQAVPMEAPEVMEDGVIDGEHFEGDGHDHDQGGDEEGHEGHSH